MPLTKGYTRAAIGENIKRERKAGRSQAQATAIALNTARMAQKKAGKRPMKGPSK